MKLKVKYILQVNKYFFYFLLFSLELDLAHPVLPLQSSYKVMSTKIEIKLKKAEGEKCVCKGQVWRVTVELLLLSPHVVRSAVGPARG